MMRQTFLAEWDEEQHPRDEHGRFTSGGSDDSVAQRETSMLWRSKNLGVEIGAMRVDGIWTEVQGTRNSVEFDAEELMKADLLTHTHVAFGAPRFPSPDDLAASLGFGEQEMHVVSERGTTVVKWSDGSAERALNLVAPGAGNEVLLEDAGPFIKNYLTERMPEVVYGSLEEWQTAREAVVKEFVEEAGGTYEVR